MFTSTEKKYLALTLVFLATGTGIKAYRHSRVQIGPAEDPGFAMASDSAQKQPGSGESEQIQPIGTAAPRSPDGPDSVGAPAASAGSPEGSMAVDSSADHGSVRDRHPSRAGTASSASTHKADFAGKVSLNHAGPVELTAIRGIGKKTAELIVQYRKEHGPYHDLRELLQVKGIGEKKMEKIIPFLIL